MADELVDRDGVVYERGRDGAYRPKQGPYGPVRRPYPPGAPPVAPRPPARGGEFAQIMVPLSLLALLALPFAFKYVDDTPVYCFLLVPSAATVVFLVGSARLSPGSLLPCILAYALFTFAGQVLFYGLAFESWDVLQEERILQEVALTSLLWLIELCLMLIVALMARGHALLSSLTASGIAIGADLLFMRAPRWFLEALDKVYGDLPPRRLTIALGLPFEAWDRYFAVMGATGVLCLLIALWSTPFPRLQPQHRSI